MSARTDYSLDHLRSISKGYIALVVALLLAAAITLDAIVQLVQDGLVATDLAQQGTQAGATWGLYIGTFEWFAGMAVGALAITGYIRYFGLEEYSMIARLSNIWAFICGLSAAWLIIIDLGTPHRVLIILTRWHETVLHSPLAWDVTFVTTLMVFTLTMLVISLRLDFLRTDAEFPIHTRVVMLLVGLGATEGEESKLESMRKWLGLGLLVLAFTAGVIPGLLLGVVGGQPGYFGSERGLVFLAGGLLTGVALLNVTAGVLRKVFSWRDQLSNEVFRGLGKALTVFGFVYLIVLFNDVVTVVTDMAPFFEQRIGDAMIAGSLAPFFWLSVLLVAVPTLLFAIFQYRLGVTVQSVYAGAILLGVWIKAQLTVVEPLLFPNLPGFEGTYSPTLVEWVITLGAIAIALLLFVLAFKLVPLTGDRATEPIDTEAPDEQATDEGPTEVSA